MSAEKKYDVIQWLVGKNMRWLLHVIFWIAVLVFYTIFFGYHNVNYDITFSFVIVLLPVTIITTYFLNYELIPNYLFKKRYLKFFLYFIYTLIVSFYIEMVTVFVIFIAVAELNLEELHPSNTNALFLIAGMYVVVFLGVAVKLFSHYTRNQLEIEKLKKEKIESELKFLKTQLHPHFLFNTLNNLYSLTLEKSEKASDVVLKLSELLDYILYECNDQFLPLGKEVKQIENYIELEKLRYGDRLRIDFSLNQIDLQQKIPPMLLLTLVENSFKHGISKTMDNSWIKIILASEGEWTRFSIQNSKHEIKESKPLTSGGIGLQNLRNRLKLIYKDQYILNIDDKSSTYGVSLKVKNILKS